ncbi:hypothetical protein I6J77_07910 [Rhodanobacter sp. FDAARGOS 1247]|uniref:hypothetical protein n=1 Tax=Rhodanobacter sp. FDAARGOS 1247 TaxID=2778082 RepID=UPI00194F7313|nr:hypothetical protein [Rhodanobacter sp. FDAARGOS 1247]QRP65331.1 hypothetical protein I6J77_07910 [Rhodanobacter sp. FDAARGOS 1247]
MKFYGVMGGILFLDLLFFWVLTRFYVPMPGTHAMVVMRRAFFSPIFVVSVLQLIKLILNVSKGYVVSIRGIRFVKSVAAEEPFGFVFGLLLELGIWSLLGIVMLNVLMRT